VQEYQASWKLVLPVNFDGCKHNFGSMGAGKCGYHILRFLQGASFICLNTGSEQMLRRTPVWTFPQSKFVLSVSFSHEMALSYVALSYVKENRQKQSRVITSAVLH
jgi:hypothetical protein